MNGPHPAPCPTHCAWQVNVGTQTIGGRFQARCLLHRPHHRLDLDERGRQPCGQTIGQPAKGGVSLWAVPASDSSTGGAFTRVAAMATKRATASRMQGATLKGCQAPGLLANVVLAGEPRLESKLHRPTARTVPTVAGHFLITVIVSGLAESLRPNADYVVVNKTGRPSRSALTLSHHPNRSPVSEFARQLPVKCNPLRETTPVTRRPA